MINLNLKKIKIADTFPISKMIVYQLNEEIKKISTYDLFKSKEVILFSNPGVFVASYMASQIPTYESNYNQVIETGIDDIYCLVNNDHFVVANFASKFKINNIKFICDPTLDVTNKIGYLSDFSDQNLGLRCWPILIHLKDNVVYKIFYEDFAVAPIDCYSATSCLTLLNYLKGLKK